MIASTELLNASAERPLALRRRGDLISSRQTYLGRTYWIVKDPLTLSFFRFEEEEYSILQLLDGQHSPAEIQREFERRFAPQQLALSELQSLLGRLFRSSLVTSDAPGQGEQLLERHRRHRAQQRQSKWSNILCIRFDGVDPDRFLQWLNHCSGWFFSWPAVLTVLLMACCALALVTTQFDLFLHRLPHFRTFFGGENWLVLAAVLAGVKILHELGHGLACKRFGGECHEMGLMLLVLTPCLYCNVSDSWMLKSKWQRAAIGAAGMYVELVLASLCTFIWWFSDVGFWHFLCLDIMFVCSVSTLLFNANPLLRYDGYFILSDLLEMPNLRQKAGTLVQQKMGSWLLGIHFPTDPFLPQRRRWLFAGYAVAATIYRWFVVASILWFLYKICEPYGLKIVGQLLVIVSLYGLFLVPLNQFVRFLLVPGRTRHVKKLRVIASLVLLSGLAVAGLMIPLPHHVYCKCRFQARNADTVYVDIPGLVTAIYAQPGEYVEAGQVVMALKNREIERTMLQLLGQREQLSARLTALQLQVYDQQAALLEITEVQQSISSLDQRIARRQEDLERLLIRAPRSGYVFAMPVIDPPENKETLPFWSGHPLQQENLTAFLRQGVPICYIADRNQLDAMLEIDESAVEAVLSGQSVELYPEQMRGDRIIGQVAQISETDLRITPASFASNSTIATSRQTSGQRLPQSLANTYQASVPVEQDAHVVLCGGRGLAKIDAGTWTLAERTWQSLCRTFHFEL